MILNILSLSSIATYLVFVCVLHTTLLYNSFTCKIKAYLSNGFPLSSTNLKTITVLLYPILIILNVNLFIISASHTCHSNNMNTSATPKFNRHHFQGISVIAPFSTFYIFVHCSFMKPLFK